MKTSSVKSRLLKKTITVILLLIILSITFTTSQVCLAQHVIAIKDGTIYTMKGEIIKKGTVLIRDGKIVEVGKKVKIPKNATIINAKKKFVMPGLIDAMTYFGIRPRDRNDISNPVTPQNRVVEAYYPFDNFMNRKNNRSRKEELLSGGVTTMYIAPGNRQVISGQGAVVKTSFMEFDKMIVKDPAGIDMSMGDAVKTTNRALRKAPTTRMAIAAFIRKNLISAQEAAAKAKADTSGTEPKKNPVMDPLVSLLNKEIPARIEADLPDDILTAIRIAKEFDINIIIDSGLGSHKVRTSLNENNVPVVLGPVSHPYISEFSIDNTPEMYTLRNENTAAELYKAGVKVAFGSFGYGAGFSGSRFQGRWMLLEAALAAGFGLPDEEALKAVTINAAEILGVEDRLGSLEPGKDGDIVILNGPPLDLKTWVEMVLINGKVVYNKSENNK